MDARGAGFYRRPADAPGVGAAGAPAERAPGQQAQRHRVGGRLDDGACRNRGGNRGAWQRQAKTMNMGIVRTGICVLAAFAVLAHGAVEPWSEAVLEIGAAVLLFAWAWSALANSEWKLIWNPLLWPLLGFWLVAAFQLATGITLVPFLTRIELLKYSALLALFFLCVQSYRTRAQWRNFVWFLLSLGFAVSLFAILQHFTFNGKLYWVRELQYGGIPFGPYVNRNHFAGLMELLIPPGLAIQILGAERRDQLPLVTLFTLLPIGALFLSASRGGIISFIAEVGFLAILIVV